MTVLFDSNVVIDLLTANEHADWVTARMAEIEDEVFAINPIIYAEVSVPYSAASELDELLDVLGFARLDLPWQAAFLAAKAFVAYRARGGSRASPLPDFYIGAHARTANLTLLTRDATRYRTYFPELTLIAP